MKWGTVGDFSGGIAAGGALLWAFITRRQDRRADIRRVEVARGEQANAWSEAPGPDPHATVAISNGTYAAIYESQAAMSRLPLWPPGSGPQAESRHLVAH